MRDGMIKTVAIDTSAETMKDQLDNDNEKLKIYQRSIFLIFQEYASLIVKLLKEIFQYLIYIETY